MIRLNISLPEQVFRKSKTTFYTQCIYIKQKWIPKIWSLSWSWIGALNWSYLIYKHLSQVTWRSRQGSLGWGGLCQNGSHPGSFRIWVGIRRDQSEYFGMSTGLLDQWLWSRLNSKLLFINWVIYSTKNQTNYIYGLENVPGKLGW